MPQIIYYLFQLTASLVERILDDEAETFNRFKIKKKQDKTSLQHENKQICEDPSPRAAILRLFFFQRET